MTLEKVIDLIGKIGQRTTWVTVFTEVGNSIKPVWYMAEDGFDLDGEFVRWDVVMETTVKRVIPVNDGEVKIVLNR